MTTSVSKRVKRNKKGPLTVDESEDGSVPDLVHKLGEVHGFCCGQRGQDQVLLFRRQVLEGHVILGSLKGTGKVTYYQIASNQLEQEYG